MEEIELKAHIAALEKAIKAIKSTIIELKTYPGNPEYKWHTDKDLIRQDIQDLYCYAMDLESYVRVEKRRHIARYPETTKHNLHSLKFKQVAESTPDLFQVGA